jgi:hypothetical protein
LKSLERSAATSPKSAVRKLAKACKDRGLTPDTWPFFVVGSIFVLGAVAFLIALKDMDDGFLGSDLIFG